MSLFPLCTDLTHATPAGAGPSRDTSVRERGHAPARHIQSGARRGKGRCDKTELESEGSLVGTTAGIQAHRADKRSEDRGVSGSAEGEVTLWSEEHFLFLAAGLSLL